MAIVRDKATRLGVYAKRWHGSNRDPEQQQWMRVTRSSFRAYATAADPLSGNSYDGSPSLSSPDSPSSLHQNGRFESLKSAKPFSSFLTDTFNRQHDYLRVSITEKCNLRCLYCMPADGVPLSPKKELLTLPEIFYLSSLFVSQGVTKIRLTGGEPTVHPQILPLLRDIGSLRSNGLRELALTTNGLTLSRKLDTMVESGVTGINLSLDTLDPFQFEIMTRRRGFDQVMKSINQILEMKRLGANLKLKINAVVIRGLNDEQILPFVEMTRDKDIEVRFIEYMPFEGNKWSSQKMLPYQEMLAIIRERYSDVEKVQDHPNDTSKTFKVPGFMGRIGFISSMTEHFCGSCNRLRITSDGNLKVCLFGNAEVSLRDMLRNGFNKGEPIDEGAWESMKQIEMDRKERRNDGDLGLQEKELQLLDIIGTAVKRKKARHAGIGVLEHMKNRPMILIDDTPSIEPALLIFSADTMPALASHYLPANRRTEMRFVPSPHLGFVSTISALSLSQPGIRAFSTSRTKQEPSDESESKSKSKSQQTLTHLNATGEVHMVNIPSPPPSPSASVTSTSLQSSDQAPEDRYHKPVTTRTATAISRIVFSNQQPYHLIHASMHPHDGQDDTKAERKTLPKGDVIATARIAGIMAAKRTADLIPLCHNIPLAGVSVDITLTAPTSLLPSASRPGTTSDSQEDAAPYGGIAISATVTAHAQTGVEMEALTAATVAGLSVYDMCKAVDRRMSMIGVRVVLKKGGRSGTLRDGIAIPEGQS